jgi:hypothetical protein
LEEELRSVIERADVCVLVNTQVADFEEELLRHQEKERLRKVCVCVCVCVLQRREHAHVVVVHRIARSVTLY